MSREETLPLASALVGRSIADVRQAQVAGARFVARSWNRAATVGRGQAPGIPYRTGLSRSSPRAALNAIPQFVPRKGQSFYPLWGDAEIDAVTAPMKLGDTVQWATHAAGAFFTQWGRRLNRLGRMMGSIQAPKGWPLPALEQVRQELRSWRYRP